MYPYTNFLLACIFILIIKDKISIDAVLTEDDEAVLIRDELTYIEQEADRYDWSRHPCDRSCSNNEKPKECFYVFVVEQYSTMSKACYNCPLNVTDCYRPHCIPGDGRQKTVYVVNRQMPGPPIQVCENDNIVVEVRNRMIAESTTIHWHGFKQRGTPFMDGVPYVTQCPILPGETFQYVFTATEPGTYFWHSHIGSQRADGLYGALVVRPKPRNNVHKNLYVGDFCMFIIDWMRMEGDDGQIGQYHYRTRVRPETILINGMGRFQSFRAQGTRGPLVYTPSAVFNVERNRNYRFRLIDAGAEDCPIEMSIDGHTLLLISADSNDIEPVEVNAITIWPGERVDFVINTDQSIGNYWIRYKGRGQCDPTNSSAGVYQVAILRYKGAPTTDPRAPTGYNITMLDNQSRIFNPYNRGTESTAYSFVNIPDLNSMSRNDYSLKPQADEQHYINFDLYFIDNYDFHRQNLYGFNQVSLDRRIGSFQMNHITLKMQPFPLLSQYNEIGYDALCNATNLPKRNCKKEHCACTHVIQVGLNNAVELIFVDEGKNPPIVNHPFHLHGHFFRVVAIENLQGNVTVDRVRRLDRAGKIKRRLDKAPMKDTMKAPGGGYTVVRFQANNPGYWFFHCHFEQHTNVGMSLIFKVGEHKDFPPKPLGFPTCRNFLPYNPLAFNGKQSASDKSSTNTLYMNNTVN